MGRDAQGNGTLSEALARLHQTGPEFQGYLTNHGPMVVESMVRRGHADGVHRWLDDYTPVLEELPRSAESIDAQEWRAALGDPRSLPRWLEFFRVEMAERPWRETLAVWWPRLLPGAAGGATHGVIRTGHAVRALLRDGESPERVAELGQALGYWAARWLQVPGTVPPAGELTPAQALERVPTVPDRSGGIRQRLTQLPQTAGWPESLARVAAVDGPEQARSGLERLADAATLRYLRFGHGDGVMLVHAATAPTAVLRTLPALPEEQWAPSYAVAWAASAAVSAAYQPDEAVADGERQRLLDAVSGDAADDELLARAVRHGDAHTIKLADTAVDVYQRTGNPEALAAAARALELVEPS